MSFTYALDQHDKPSFDVALQEAMASLNTTPTPEHVDATPSLADEGHDPQTSVVLPVDTASEFKSFVAKYRVAEVGALLVALYAVFTSFGSVFTADTATPMLIAFAGAFLTWLTPRASVGVLAYSKLAVLLLTAAAQVVVPVFFTHAWSWALVPVVALQVGTAFRAWLTPDGKTPLTSSSTKAA